MTIVSVDPQRRIYLPKSLDFNADKAIIIQRGENYLIIPIPKEITPIETSLSITELKTKAEEEAKKETINAHRI